MSKKRSKAARGREFSAVEKATVIERSGGWCEYCHSKRIASIHHAEFRSQLHRHQGSGGIENAIGLCFDCDGLVHRGKEGQKYRVKFAKIAKQLAEANTHQSAR